MNNFPLPSTAWDDFYDITTIKPIIDDYPEAEIRMELQNRDHRPFQTNFWKMLRSQTEAMADLTPPSDFDSFLARKVGSFLKPTGIELFMNFRHDPSLTNISQEGHELTWFAEGPIRKVWFEEIPPMCLISNLYFIGIEPEKGWENKLRNKAERMVEAGARFADFGTRRAFSVEVHRRVVEILKEYLVTSPTSGGFISTSNMHLAQVYDLTPSGTMGHKSTMTIAGIEGVQSANHRLMESWDREFRGNLGTFLPDTYTTPVALRDFDSRYARLFDSIRHDSGNPIWFTNLVIAHYKSLKINPMSKTIIFSDALDIDRALQIAEYCKGKIGCSFGIGTHLTNDVGAKPLNIVIKVTRVRKSSKHPWVPVVKLSDTPGKISGDPEIAAITKRLLGIS